MSQVDAIAQARAADILDKDLEEIKTNFLANYIKEWGKYEIFAFFGFDKAELFAWPRADLQRRNLSKRQVGN